MKIAVTGGKGGTGKSSVATALAVELAKKHKVLLVDTDTGCPNDHLLLGLERKFVKNVYQRIPKWDFDKCTNCGLCGRVCETNAIVSVKDKKPIFIPFQCNGCGTCVITCPAKAIGWDRKEIGKIYESSAFGVDFLSGELKINEPIAEFVVGAVKKELEKRENEYDFIIIDTAAGTHCDVISSIMACDRAFAVTEPTPLGAHDLELIIRLLMKLDVPFDVILNRYEKKNENIILDITRRYRKGILAKIPYKREIMEAYSKGVPIREDSIRGIARGVRK
jgi:MinD superfamily P-loop ATPase